MWARGGVLAIDADLSDDASEPDDISVCGLVRESVVCDLRVSSTSSHSSVHSVTSAQPLLPPAAASKSACTPARFQWHFDPTVAVVRESVDRQRSEASRDTRGAPDPPLPDHRMVLPAPLGQDAAHPADVLLPVAPSAPDALLRTLVSTMRQQWDSAQAEIAAYQARIVQLAAQEAAAVASAADAQARLTATEHALAFQLAAADGGVQAVAQLHSRAVDAGPLWILVFAVCVRM